MSIATAEQPRILIVEDDPSIGTMIEEVLDGKQYAVRLVTGPEDALSEVRAETPDLVLMDINLGADIDGIETVKRMRETADVPVCFITAYSDEATVARAEAVDPMAYLVKPFEMGDVTAMVKISLANARRIKEKLQQAARLEAASRQAHEAVLFLDGAGAIRSVSEAARNLLAMSPEAGAPLWEALRLSGPGGEEPDPETAGPLRETVESAAPGAEPVTWRGWSYPPEGERLPLLLSFSADAALGETICRIRKIPAAALRIGNNALAPPVPVAPQAPATAKNGRNATLAEGDLEDALTGLPNQAAIRAKFPALEENNGFLFVLFIDHIHILRQRFGSGAIDRILLSYSQHLAQHLPDGCQLARWDGHAFLIFPKDDNGAEIEREVGRVLSSPMLYHLQLSGRSALLRITAVFHTCKASAHDQSLEEQVEHIVKDHIKK
ncbi:MAG: response regulator [Bryobacteraceae bacterium]